MKYKSFIIASVTKSAGLLILLVAVLALLSCSSEPSKQQLQIGHTAPDFAAKDINGRIVILSNSDSGPILLRFFETNCRFCKADTVVFKDFYEMYTRQGLQVIYVGSFYDDQDALERFVDDHSITFPVIADQQGVLADLYDIKSYPQTVFMGPERRLEGALLGGVGSAEIEEIIGKYLPNTIGEEK